MPDRLHLSSRHRRVLEALLHEHLPGVEAWAYGSRVNGRSHDGSDLDLALRAPGLKKIPASQLADFKEAVYESTIPFLVEVRDWGRLPERFRREIERNHLSVFQTIRQEVTLGDIAEFQEGYVNPSQSNSSYFGGPIKWLRASDLNNSFVFDTSRTLSEDGYRSAGKSASLFPPDTLAISKSGTIGRLGIVKDWMCGNRAVINIRPTEDLADTRYVFYFYALLSDSRQIDTLAEGSVQRNLYVSQLSTFNLPLPELAEQRSIAGVLGALDDKIELNRRMNETLEAMARALFKSWFVDFEPVRAKMDGRDMGMPASIVSLFPDVLDNRGIPEGWTRGALARIADSPRRGVDPSEVAENTPYIGLEHMPRRSIALADWEGAAKVKSTKSTFNKGDILFGKLRPYFHKVGIASLDGICSTDIVVVTPRSPEWAAFCLACISTDEFVDYTNQTSTGTKMPRTSWKTMSQYETCLPQTQVAREFQRLLQPVIDRLNVNVHESRNLARTRTALLPKLISGETRVGDIERVIDAPTMSDS